MLTIKDLYKKLSNGEIIIITDKTGFVILKGLYRPIHRSDFSITLQHFIMEDIQLNQFLYDEKYTGLSKALKIENKTLITIEVDDLIKEVVNWYTTRGIYQILKNLKHDLKAEIAASYELLTNQPVKLKGMSGVYLMLVKTKKGTSPVTIIGKKALENFKDKLDILEPNEIIQYSYEQLKQEQKKELTKLSALVKLLEIIFHTLYYEEFGYLQIPTDKASAALTNITLKKKILKERFIKHGEIEIQIGSNQKTVKTNELENFFSSFHRTGDVYNYILHKAYHHGYTRADSEKYYKVLNITAKEIANALSPSGKASKKLIRTVAEILGEKLPAITIKIPTRAFTPEILKQLKVEKDSKYIFFSPLIYIMGESEDSIKEKTTRLYKAVISIHPLLWALYAEIGMKTSIPIEVLKLNPQYTPKRWAKMIAYKLYHHARINQKNSHEHKIKLRTILSDTGILDEIEEMRANKHQKRAFKYLKQSLDSLCSTLFKKCVLSPKQPGTLDDLLNSTISYIIKQPFE